MPRPSPKASERALPPQCRGAPYTNQREIPNPPHISLQTTFEAALRRLYQGDFLAIQIVWVDAHLKLLAYEFEESISTRLSEFFIINMEVRTFENLDVTTCISTSRFEKNLSQFW